MRKAFTLALDKSSARTLDVDGRLRVESSNITKSCVNPYFGKEIPDWEQLGLEPARIYNLLRDPAELEKAADSFTNIPLLIIHKGTTADNHDKQVVVGTVGDATWNAPYITASLCVWTEEAIAGIQSKQQTELSCGYRYRPDMTPGTYEGVEYDGVMRDIIGNHVALVEVGRAGSDVVVADSNPFDEATMKHKQRLNAAQAQARQALGLAEDADLSKLTPILLSLMANDADKDDKAEDGLDGDEDEGDEEEKKRKKAAAGASDAPNDPEGGPENRSQAMDAATVQRAIDAAVAQAKVEVEALNVARNAVAPLVGHVALDSADAVYKFALDHAKVDTAGVHPSAYPALLKMHLSASAVAPTPRLGMDSASIQSADKRFGDSLTRFAKI